MMKIVKVSDATRDELKQLKSELSLRSMSDVLDYLMDETAEQGRRTMRAIGQNGEPLKIQVDRDGIVWVSIDPYCQKTSRLPCCRKPKTI